MLLSGLLAAEGGSAADTQCGTDAMRVLLLLTVLALGGCASFGGGSGNVPSSAPSRVCTYEPSFSQPGRTDVQCF